MANLVQTIKSWFAPQPSVTADKVMAADELHHRISEEMNNTDDSNDGSSDSDD